MTYVDMYEEDIEQEQNKGEKIDIDTTKRELNTTFDHTLFNNFWLNEIKSTDDSSRLLINVIFILSGAYITIIAANIDKIIKATGMHDESGLIFLFVLLFVPFLSLIPITIASIRSQLSPLDGTDGLTYVKFAPKYLRYLASFRKQMLIYSYVSAFIPIIYLSAITLWIVASWNSLVEIILVFIISICIIIYELFKNINDFNALTAELSNDFDLLKKSTERLKGLCEAYEVVKSQSKNDTKK